MILHRPKWRSRTFDNRHRNLVEERLAPRGRKNKTVANGRDRHCGVKMKREEEATGRR